MSAGSLAGKKYDPHAGRGHVESWFVKANDPTSGRAIWLRFTLFVSAKRGAVAEVWAIAFDRRAGHTAAKSTVPLARAHFAEGAIGATIDGCTLDAQGTRGSVVTGSRKISWNLRFQSDQDPLVHLAQAWMYGPAWPATKLVSLFPDLRVSGDIEVDGRPWQLESWPGLLGHNWGRRHAKLYAWGHCNAWDEEPDLVVEGFSARAKMGPLATPLTTLLAVLYKGERYTLNGAVDLVRNRGLISPRRWKFNGKSAQLTLEGELWAETDDFVGLYYENPDGPVTHCLNSTIAHARVELAVRGRAPIVVHSRAAALEIGTHDPSHGVRMYV